MQPVVQPAVQPVVQPVVQPLEQKLLNIHYLKADVFIQTQRSRPLGL